MLIECLYNARDAGRETDVANGYEGLKENSFAHDQSRKSVSKRYHYNPAGGQQRFSFGVLRGVFCLRNSSRRIVE